MKQAFGVGRSPLLSENTLGHKSLKEKSLKEEIDEEEIRVSLRFVYSFFPLLFSFL